MYNYRNQELHTLETIERLSQVRQVSTTNTSEHIDQIINKQLEMLVLLREKQLEQVTVDHSLDAEKDTNDNG